MFVNFRRFSIFLSAISFVQVVFLSSMDKFDLRYYSSRYEINGISPLGYMLFIGTYVIRLGFDKTAIILNVFKDESFFLGRKKEIGSPTFTLTL